MTQTDFDNIALAFYRSLNGINSLRNTEPLTGERQEGWQRAVWTMAGVLGARYKDTFDVERFYKVVFDGLDKTS